MDDSEHFVFVLVDEFSHIAFSCALEPLRIANLVADKPLFSWSFAAENGECATSSNGSVTRVHHGFGEVPVCSRLFVLSGINMSRHVTSELLGLLRRTRARGNPIGALCSGAFILAKAGFLNGRRAAIHWDFHDSFIEQFPQVELVSSVFVADEKFITAAGGVATADLMLHLIAERHGSDLATAVADQMVYTGVRDATAVQRVSLYSRNGLRNNHLVKAIRLMQEALETPLPAAEIARQCSLSRRQLERLFCRYLKCSPTRYYMELRLERARHLLIQTDRSIAEVAFASGFESPSHFARRYRAIYGVAPKAQRLLCS